MDKKLQEIIRLSTFEIQDGDFVYTKVSEMPDSGDHFMISRDEAEITVVTQKENISDLKITEKNKEEYKLIALNVSVPFYAVGFLAAVSSAIADRGMNILIISTYSKDYIMVKKEVIVKAKEALFKLGFKETNEYAKR